MIYCASKKTSFTPNCNNFFMISIVCQTLLYRQEAFCRLAPAQGWQPWPLRWQLQGTWCWVQRLYGVWWRWQESGDRDLAVTAGVWGVATAASHARCQYPWPVGPKSHSFPGRPCPPTSSSSVGWIERSCQPDLVSRSYI